jgi:short subunit fatty acids transporter
LPVSYAFVVVVVVVVVVAMYAMQQGKQEARKLQQKSMLLAYNAMITPSNEKREIVAPGRDH